MQELSVIVPVYNVEKYLPDCLDSLISQTLKKFQIICVDDGSTDGSRDVLKEYAKKDKRITVINKKNGGLSSARNAGLKKCTTKYVMFCDGDDSFTPGMCETMLSAIKTSEADFAACGIEVIYLADEAMKKSDDEYYKIKYCGKYKVTRSIIHNTDVSTCNKIYRMDLINQYHIEFPEGLDNEDFYFSNAYAAIAKTVFFVDEKLYRYTRREGSIMNKNFAKTKVSLDHLLVAEKLFGFYEKNHKLKNNIELLWQLWVDSYWFSIQKSPAKLSKKVREEARKFVESHQAYFETASQTTQQKIKLMLYENTLRKLIRRAMNLYSRISLKLFVSVRQRRDIFMAIDELQHECEDLIEKIKTD